MAFTLSMSHGAIYNSKALYYAINVYLSSLESKQNYLNAHFK